ncbi:uncharacterized protein LOC131689240 [Topomyia yanbarensis]|uniref:uncharacterized protein LOC131689240 n=1 Tax=Topomyia yanbarensis TaxID=2498891 RepID=UPI00273B0F87|nr:uncharacterized protein LOC131689240 [Topomyia yanbarensis]
MWSSRKPKQIDPETLAEVPRKIRFNLFHRPKEIVGKVGTKNGTVTEKVVVERTKDVKQSNSKNRPKVNLFPQISLNDLRDKELDNVVEYMYSSDWKEMSSYTASVSCMNLGASIPLNEKDITSQYTDHFKRKTQKTQAFDLPLYEVDLAKWYR